MRSGLGIFGILCSFESHGWNNLDFLYLIRVKYMHSSNNERRGYYLTEKIDTLIIGAGPAGLSLSYYLTQQQRPHLLLEQTNQLANPWRNQRWDSFTLVTPNWMIRLPGGEYTGGDTDGFMRRDEVGKYLESYAASFSAPVRFGTRASTVDPDGAGYRIQTNVGEFKAKNVVIATGMFNKPRLPAFSANLPSTITQLHSGEYRNPAQLPPGAILVAGSAQSGCQIAEELYQSGCKVYLSTGGSSGRAPRRYRGQETTRWLAKIGFFDRTVDMLTSPKEKFGGNPQLSGKGGGHTLNLHQFTRDGVRLLGRITGAQDGRLTFAPDLKDNLAKIDAFEADVVKLIDQFIAQNHISALVETLPLLTDGYAAEIITELDLEAAGIGTLIWALGYQFDFSWVHLPVFDNDGFPIHQGGVTAFPGLYFQGLLWQQTKKSGSFFGFDEDAAYIAARLE
jgi:putative flavoprotein involved in K+ transport